MFKHYLILLENDYNKKMVCFHKLLSNTDDFIEIQKIKNKLLSLNIKFVTHLISTKDKSFKSVKQKDAFFENALFITDYNHFLDIAKESKRS